jgi:hypothetical protein
MNITATLIATVMIGTNGTTAKTVLIATGSWKNVMSASTGITTGCVRPDNGSIGVGGMSIPIGDRYN